MRPTLLRPESICWLCLLIVSFSTMAQTPSRNDSGTGASGGRGNHVIRGKIFLPSGRLPEVRMRVVLELVGGGIFTETFSDSVGGFEFRSLPNNNYRIVVPSDGQGYEKAEENLEVSGGVARTFTSQLFLREKESANPLTMNNKMVSAAEFSQEVPKGARKSYEQGLKRLKDGKQDEAITHFQAALKEFPDYVLALNKIGEMEVARQRFVEAEALFKRSAAISPKFPQTQIYLGMLMVQMTRFPEAIEHLDAAINLDESFPMAHLNLGIALMGRTPQLEKDMERAERAFGKALALGGKQLAYAHKYLFNVYIKRQDYNRAAAELEAYLKESPNAPDAVQVQDMLSKVKKAAQAPPAKLH